MLLLAIGLYGVLGKPDLASASNQRSKTPAATRTASDPGGKKTIASVDTLLASLEQRLQQDPSDSEGWLLLARSYEHLGRARDAAEAYAKAVALGTEDPAFAAKLLADGQQRTVRYPIDSDDIKTFELIVD